MDSWGRPLDKSNLSVFLLEQKLVVFYGFTRIGRTFCLAFWRDLQGLIRYRFNSRQMYPIVDSL